MTREAKKYTVHIFGEPYTLVTDEPEAAIMESVARVNALMHELSDTFKSKETKRLAILTALHSTHSVINLEAHVKQAEDRIIERIDRVIEPS